MVNTAELGSIDLCLLLGHCYFSLIGQFSVSVQTPGFKMKQAIVSFN